MYYSDCIKNGFFFTLRHYYANQDGITRDLREILPSAIANLSDLELSASRGVGIWASRHSNCHGFASSASSCSSSCGCAGLGGQSAASPLGCRAACTKGKHRFEGEVGKLDGTEAQGRDLVSCHRRDGPHHVAKLAVQLLLEGILWWCHADHAAHAEGLQQHGQHVPSAQG